MCLDNQNILNFCPAEPKTSRAFSICSSDSQEVTEILILALFFGTVGNRIGWAKIPFLYKYFPKSMAIFSFPIIIGII